MYTLPLLAIFPFVAQTRKFEQLLINKIRKKVVKSANENESDKTVTVIVDKFKLKESGYIMIVFMTIIHMSLNHFDQNRESKIYNFFILGLVSNYGIFLSYEFFINS